MRLSARGDTVRQRIIRFELFTNKAQGIILDSLTYAAGKLWNVANYGAPSKAYPHLTG